jgi:hypothetical protein
VDLWDSFFHGRGEPGGEALVLGISRRWGMTRGMMAIVVLALICACVSAVQAGPFGVGIMAGEPTGLTFKQWMAHGRAIDLAAAWSFTDYAAVHIHMDYLFHFPGPPEIEVPGLLFHFGLGGRIKLAEDGDDKDSDNRLGLRIPIGFDYLMARSHLEVFLEVAPIMDLAPETELRMNGGIGIRYYFGGRPRSRRI